MNIDKSSRFKDAPWFPKEDTTLLIGGAGGIGSWLTLLLTRAGFTPIVYDFDIIEEHNLGGQLFSCYDIGKYKVAALFKIVKDLTEESIIPITDRYDNTCFSSTYVFSAFDNMEARKIMFDKWVLEIAYPWLESSKEDKNKTEPIFIDGRLTMEQLQIFCVLPKDIERYKENLFDDADVPDAPCTMKQTSHSATMIASYMTAFFTNHFTNVISGDKERNIPFKWEYFIPINYLSEI